MHVQQQLLRRDLDLGLAHVYDDGVERLDENGEPVTLMTLFPKEKAEIIDNPDTLECAALAATT